MALSSEESPRAGLTNKTFPLAEEDETTYSLRWNGGVMEKRYLLIFGFFMLSKETDWVNLGLKMVFRVFGNKL